MLGPEQNFTQIACGTYHTLVINAAGDIFCWGAGTEGRIGLQDSAFKAPRRCISSKCDCIYA